MTLRIGRPGGREAFLAELRSGPETEWDVLVVGGGITGAGVLREAARRGVKALLVERRDFAWGTSSRSSKMVHGGLRYLASGQFGLTRDSVRERQRLLREIPGLVRPLAFLMGHYRHRSPGPLALGALLTVYDRMAGGRNHAYHPKDDALWLAPGLASQKLKGVTRFGDAVTDDARLVLRVLDEASRDGGVAVNYVAARNLLKENGRVRGAVLRDEMTGEEWTVRARAVVNAAGVWSDRLGAEAGAAAHIRPLRGSHLVVPFWRLPVSFAVSFMHPDDRRPVFVFPWEGVTLIGTTDLDHRQDADDEASITPQEVDYLLAAANHAFPGHDLSRSDITATFAGVRPVVGSGEADPSKEKREHVIHDDSGLITVAGGKLTTFRLIARDALAAARPYLPDSSDRGDKGDSERIFAPLAWNGTAPLSPEARERLAGRYGDAAADLLAEAEAGDLTRIGSTDTLWAELRWAAGHESVVHLDDLLLRRTRIGLLLPDGGEEFLPRIEGICRRAIGWDEARWRAELERYRDIRRRCYGVPGERQP